MDSGSSGHGRCSLYLKPATAAAISIGCCTEITDLT